MTATDIITDITDYLTDWNVAHTVADHAITVANHAITVDADYPYTITVDGPDVDSAMTSDTTTAAAIAAFPAARQIFEAGARIDDVVTDRWGAEITAADGLGVTILAREDGSITVTDHPLMGRDVDMSDIHAVIESAQLHYSPVEAWTVLAAAEDFEDSAWEETVEALCPDATLSSRDQLTHATQDRDGQAALVEDRGEFWTVTDVDPLSLTQAVCHTHADVAAAVLSIIAY